MIVFLLMVLGFAGLASAQETRPTPGFFDFWLMPRVWMGALFALIGLALLIKSWVTRNVRLVALVLTFFVFGVLSVLPLGNFARGMSMHPSPLCMTTKPFLFMQAGQAVPVVFLSLIAAAAILTIIGNKLFCGWVCPIGALQEIFHRILPKSTKIKLPFKWTNIVRIAFLVLFLIVLFGFGKDLYEYVNPFEFLHWGFEALGITIVCAVLAASLFIFRPFCYVFCPLGLLTWVLEQFSIIRVKVDKDKCTDCGVCTDESPCPTMPSILEGKKVRPDCHPCGRCIELCPEKALKFKK